MTADPALPLGLAEGEGRTWTDDEAEAWNRREIADFRMALALNDGFVFHIIVAETRDQVRQALAAAGVTAPGWFEPASMGDQEPLEAAQQLLRGLDALFQQAEHAPRPVVLNLAGRDRAEEPALRLMFRILNQHRDGIRRQVPAPFLLALSRRLEALFIAEAPDFRAIRSSGMRLALPPPDLSRENTAAVEAPATPRFSPGNREDLERRLSEARARSAPLQDLAALCASLGEYHADSAPERALPFLEEAAGYYRTLMAQGRGQFRSNLADLLRRIGKVQSALGAREAALAATREAVELHRALAAAQPHAFRPALAGSLNNLGNRLSELGEREAALAAARDATELYRTLAATRPDAFRPDLASSLNNLGNSLSALGEREAALAATREATDLCRSLVEAQPEAFRPDLARSLNNLGAMLSALGEREASLAAAQEATELYRTLVAARPDAFQPDLARSLNNLGNSLSALGEREAALAAAREATDLYRSLAVTRPDPFRPNLALSLNNLGAKLSDLGEREPALAAAREAVGIYTDLARQHPQAFTQRLGISTRSLRTRLQEAGLPIEGDPVLQAAEAELAPVPNGPVSNRDAAGG